MIIAVDFDGTLCENAFPEIGKPIDKVINYIKQAIANGDTVILWTCRENDDLGNRLTQALDWCKDQGIEFHSVNEFCHPEWGSGGRKVCADIYIDDRAIHPDHI
jgi:hypothetical protein